jgi:hypothetical protein
MNIINIKKNHKFDLKGKIKEDGFWNTNKKYGRI